ncbi:MAG: flavodoxin family protein [Clostridia bacterium]|nr:flavodoxin family protein [Clostridia bacterium]
MIITMVNGIAENQYPDESNEIVSAAESLKTEHQVNLFNLNKLDVHPCSGCWTCWIKEPGRCVYDDDMTDIYRSTVKSDVLIWISQIKAGFVQSDIRMATERMFALLLPHMMELNGEMHHIPRYEKQPKLGLVIVGESEHDLEQEEILKEYMYRLSLNFNKASGNFVHYFELGKGKELADEIINL